MEERGLRWSDFSFIVSSAHREKVISRLSGRPKVPKQLSQETGLRIFHVSRALRELRDRGLVECLTPTTKGRGRLYALTGSGATLLRFLNSSSERYTPSLSNSTADFHFVPKVRASTLLRSLAYLKNTKGEAAVQQALRAWPVDPRALTEDTWLSVDHCAQFLELVEQHFGDGSYAFIRNLFAKAVVSFPTIREELTRPLPLETLAERAPIVYSKEWNFGRLAVKAARRKATFKHYDWMPTQAMCALFHGVYEGVLRARGFAGKVTKTLCVRKGDDHCEYVVEW